MHLISWNRGRGILDSILNGHIPALSFLVRILFLVRIKETDYRLFLDKVDLIPCGRGRSAGRAGGTLKIQEIPKTL